MNAHDYWEKAVRQTEIVRPRVQPLALYSATQLPYVFLAESALNSGDTVVRRGDVSVEKPSLILPSDQPQFQGFQAGDEPAWDSEAALNFLFVRGVRFPSWKFNNQTNQLDIYEGRLAQAERHYRNELEQKENLTTGLVIGPEDCWQFSVIIFIASQAGRQVESDFRRLWEDSMKKDSGL